MATLTLIGEPFPDWEAEVQRAAVRDLTTALAATAPRACSTRLIVARGSEAPELSSAKARVATLPFTAGMLPVLWQSGATARPLDGEFCHALTPMIPLRSRNGEDGSQTSVCVPHTLAWQAPELMGGTQARLFRAFARRAAKHADAILAPTHAVASTLQERFGSDLPVQVLPLAAPAEFCEPADAAERREALGLPERFFVTTANTAEQSRLQWVLDAMETNPNLPALVIIEGLDPAPAEPKSSESKNSESTGPASALQAAIPSALQERVQIVQPRDLHDVGAIVSAASLLVQPQAITGTNYLLFGALDAGVPVLHAGLDATAEIIFDAGVAATDAGSFAAELGRLERDAEELERLTVLAHDRGRAFTWEATAWQVWELHANL